MSAVAGIVEDAARGVPVTARVPGWNAVVGEQLRRTGLAIRREALYAGVLVLLFGTLPVLLAHWRTPGHRSDMQFDELMLITALLGSFAPLAVWRGEEPSRRAYFWALPVDASRHSLARVLAGWAWTMLAVAALVAWVVLLARATGGELSNGDAFVPLRPLAEDAPWRLEDHFHRPWPIPAWQWLVPFAAATALYLVGSAVALASDHPWRWYAGTALVIVLMLAAGSPWARRAAGTLVEGRYGLEMLVTGSELRAAEVTTPEGHVVRHTMRSPQPSRWLAASALWLGIGVAGVLAAAHRRKER